VEWLFSSSPDEIGLATAITRHHETLYRAPTLRRRPIAKKASDGETFHRSRGIETSSAQIRRPRANALRQRKREAREPRLCAVRGREPRANALRQRKRANSRPRKQPRLGAVRGQVSFHSRVAFGVSQRETAGGGNAAGETARGLSLERRGLGVLIDRVQNLRWRFANVPD
jgi:hypothetical protein